MAGRLGGIKNKFAIFGAPATIAQIDRLVYLLEREEVFISDAKRMFCEIQLRFLDEIRETQFFALSAHKSQQ